MLSQEENELICRVGPGTPMGELLREYWMPALISDELPEHDGAPLRVRLLGEDLIAFRDTSGRVGLIQNACMHRGASLFFGRNEEDGLRCVYHGWKYDVTGQCVDMPNEPAESNFKSKIRAVAYPCVERGGIVWAYMKSGPFPSAPFPLKGEQDLSALPPIPAFESNSLPLSHLRLGRRYQETNYMQSLEGGIDSAHASFLHSTLQPQTGSLLDQARRQDKSVTLQVERLENGLLIGARRGLPDGNDYWRMNLFMMPFYTQSPGEGRHHFNAWVPMDDETTLRVSVVWDPAQPITDEQVNRPDGRYNLPGGFIAPVDLLPATSEPGGAWKAKANKTNDYFIDRELYRTSRFFGVDRGSIGTQDLAVQESMGRIWDRRKEHLGTTDLGVIQARRMLIDSAVALRDEHVAPPGINEPDAYRIHAVGFQLPRGDDWTTVAKEKISTYATAK